MRVTMKANQSKNLVSVVSHDRSLRSRRFEVVGEGENGRARGRHACLLLARPFFLVPATSKRLLRRLARSTSALWTNGF